MRFSLKYRASWSNGNGTYKYDIPFASKTLARKWARKCVKGNITAGDIGWWHVEQRFHDGTHWDWIKILGGKIRG